MSFNIKVYILCQHWQSERQYGFVKEMEVPIVPVAGDWLTVGKNQSGEDASLQVRTRYIGEIIEIHLEDDVIGEDAPEFLQTPPKENEDDFFEFYVDTLGFTVVEGPPLLGFFAPE